MRAWVYVLVSTSRYGGGAGGGGLRTQLGWAWAGSAATEDTKDKVNPFEPSKHNGHNPHSRQIFVCTVYRVFKLNMHENKHLLGHQKCTFKL